MRRTGNQAPMALVGLLLATGALAAQPVVTQEVDRTEVGVDDTFVLTVRAVDAPSGSTIQLPDVPELETLSTARGTHSSIQFGGSGPHVQQTSTLTARMRANRVGRLTIPPAELRTPSGVFKSQPLTLTVRKDHVPDPRAGSGRQRLDPFSGFNPFPEDEDNPFDAFQRRQAPGERDLFFRTELDKREVFEGEQATLSLWIYARVDVSHVDSLTMPKMDGFWTEDVETPTQLSQEMRTIDGVLYRVYLLKRLALFPMKAGTRELGAVGVDITTGFLFAGRREHRNSQPLTLRVKPLPPGAPAGFQPNAVGTWTLAAELSAPRAELGAPVTLRVTLDGRGNLKDLVPPRPTVPAALKLYDPTTTDKTSSVRGRIQGRRVQEYLVLPQRTGIFEIPSMELAYFDPETRRYEHARTEPLSLTVVPGPGTGPAVGMSAGGAEPNARNVLTASALRPLRVGAVLDRPPLPWRQPWFLAALLAPPLLFAGAGLGSWIRRARLRADPRSELRRREQRARGRLASLRRKSALDAPAFCAEVDGALSAGLAARLNTPVGGLTREMLLQRLIAAGAPAEVLACVGRVQDACDEVRFAPGVARLDREKLLADAEAALADWESA